MRVLMIAPVLFSDYGGHISYPGRDAGAGELGVDVAVVTCYMGGCAAFDIRRTPRRCLGIPITKSVPPGTRSPLTPI